MNKQLKELFRKSGFNQTEFAKLVGLSQPKLNDLIHGKAILSETKYAKLKDLYKANIIVSEIIYLTECHLVVNPKLSVFYINIQGFEFEMHIYKPKYIGVGKIEYEYLEVKKVYDVNGQVEYDVTLINKLLNDE